MSSNRAAVTPGDQFINTDLNERCTVLALESRGDTTVALLQYEDGIPWDEPLVDGILPSTYQPLPTPPGRRGPLLRDACDPEQHVFNIEPQRHPPEGIRCENCRLSDAVLMEFLGHSTIDRLPVVCTFCGDALDPDDDRYFAEDHFMCIPCRDAHWDVYADRPYADLDQYVLYCTNTPIATGTPTDCGYIAALTPESSQRHLSAPFVEGVEAGENAPCPECGGNVMYRSLSPVDVTALAGILNVSIPENPVPGDLFTGDDQSYVLDTDAITAYHEYEADRVSARTPETYDASSGDTVFDTIPVAELSPVACPATDILTNLEPGSRVLGWPTPEYIDAVHRLRENAAFVEEIEAGIAPEGERHPTYIVVQTRDDAPPSSEATATLEEIGYTPLDGETTPVCGGGGWPVTMDVGYEDHPLVGTYIYQYTATCPALNED